MKYLLSILSFIIISSISAQAEFTITTANVLGKPKIIAQGEVASSINMVIAAWSAEEVKLRNSTISTDGKTYTPVLNKDSLGNNYIAKFKENDLYTEVMIIWNTENLKESEILHTSKLIDAMTMVSEISAPSIPPAIKTAATQVDKALEARTDYEGDEQNILEVNEVNKESKLAKEADDKAKLKAEQKAQKDAVKAAKIAAKKIEKNNKKIDRKIDGLDKENDSKARAIKDNLTQIASLETSITQFDEKAKKKDIKAIKKDIKKINKTTSKAQSRIDKLKKGIIKKEAQIVANNITIGQIEVQKTSSEKIDALKKEARSMEKKIESLQKSNTKIKEGILNDQSEITQLQNTVDRDNEAVKNKEADISAIEKSIVDFDPKRKKKELKVLTKKNKKLEKSISKNNKESSHLQEEKE
jgi:DNA repair exonuclease SbcCD ATPase subunit